MPLMVSARTHASSESFNLAECQTGNRPFVKNIRMRHIGEIGVRGWLLTDASHTMSTSGRQCAIKALRGHMTELIELLKRYNEPAPRYTSYPTAPNWLGANRGLLISALRRSTAPLSIYVHIPFCERLCLYCGCNVVIRKDHSLADAYINRLDDEIELVDVAHNRVVTQMHWGGGTPTYLDPRQLET